MKLESIGIPPLTELEKDNDDSNIKWDTIDISPDELNLSFVLRCGQSFRWQFNNNIWSCSFNNKIILLKQDKIDKINNKLNFYSLPSKTHNKYEISKFIYDYFNLNINLNDLYKNWLILDNNLKLKIENLRFNGIRILRQDPWENLICFICSSNNNIKRISKMCNNLCSNYGKFIMKFQDLDYYSFPTYNELLISSVDSNQLELELRSLGFGYRANYIYETCQFFKNDSNNLNILYDLREIKDFNEKSIEINKFLLNLKGVGPKIADCVALMSLDCHDIVPIDTHVFQIAKKNYKFNKYNSITNKNYIILKKFFKDLWGDYAGWAHTILFTAELNDFKDIDGDSEPQIIPVKKERTTKELKRKLKIEDEEDVKPIISEFSADNGLKKRRTRQVIQPYTA
ncbi:unnamed protein product [[Candida] boidinii]|uniref:DNA-(apurinic or apyrimidinic site) lyase n=1 Tax=Candida boidinii TaxID=5477 RepID=A0A9W6STX7_CANBO|nr:lyase activity protein [[Candida] boidinii]GME66713.1 unnamed protein product [[Candida] boidinii]GMF52142.1 unnamed protein product [[Candida] boidinii]